MQPLRSLSQLESLILPPSISLPELLAPGHQLRLRELIGTTQGTQEDSQALATMPSLTDVRFDQCMGMEFVHALPQLCSLQLSFSPQCPPIDAAVALSALQTCTQLTRLDLGLQPDVCQLSSEQWGELLPRMPLLQDLRISRATQTTTLSFLTRGPITRTLTSLCLSSFNPRVRLEELMCVHTLRSLQSLTVHRVFDRAIDPFIVALYQRPSLLIPSLLDLKLVA